VIFFFSTFPLNFLSKIGEIYIYIYFNTTEASQLHNATCYLKLKYFDEPNSVTCPIENQT
jgi:hypothetical protein